MPHNQVEAEGDSPQSLGIFLEIRGQGGEGPLQLPAIVRGFGADLITLEVHDLWGRVGCSSLVGQGGSLHLPAAGSDGTQNLPGTVTWAREAGGHLGQWTLGLKLARPSRTTLRLLEDRLPHPPADIKGLWERWEQARTGRVSAAVLSPRQHCLAGLGLLVGGLTCLTMQVNGGKALKWFGVVWSICGCVVIAATALWYWWRKRGPAD